MGLGYQRTDRQVIDYEIWFDDRLPGITLRGPEVALDPLPDIAFLGAAQTFGRFVQRPFARSVGDILGCRTLNLGSSGAGPGFFLRKSQLMTLISGIDTVVVQSMSGRSVTAGLFKATGNNGVLEFLSGPRKGERHLALEAYRLLRTEMGKEAFDQQVAAARSTWVQQHAELADRISGRKIFLWLSEYAPGENCTPDKGLIGAFPHFVTAEMVESVTRMGFQRVDAISGPLKPQILFSDRTGRIEQVFSADRFPRRPEKLRAVNTYYATQDMHDLASRQLVRTLL